MSDQQIRAQSPPTEPPAPQNQGAPGDQPLDFLVGQYRREPMLNNWHQGTIQMAAGGQTLVWKNDAGAAWGLTPDLKDGILITDFKENPFYDSQPERGRVFRLRMLPNDAGVDGFEFLGDFYRRVSPQKPVTPYQPTSQHTPGAPTLRHQPNRDTGAEPVTPSAPSESGDTDTAPDTLPVVLTTADPEYTVLARRAQVSGVVWVVVDIDTTGHPVNPHVMRELGFGLDEEAIKAVDKWTFQPATKDGKPVPSKMWIQITFRLP
jgi:TonB family protein